MTMSIDAEPITLDWVAVGASAFGLLFTGRIVALVYWEGADVAARSGFSWVPVDVPGEQFHLFQVPNPTEGDWARARELTARAYFEWPGASVWREAAAMPRSQRSWDERLRDAALRREAAELLSRSPWWQEELLRDELLRREWRGPETDERG